MLKTYAFENLRGTKMKLLVLIAFIIAVHSYAQDDGYHVTSKPSCTHADRACLVINGSELQMIDVQNRSDDVVGSRLNSRQALSGLTNSDEVCVKNTTKGVCGIIESMAGVDDLYYAQGGHIYIEDLECNEQGVSFTEVIEWTPMGYDHRNIEFKLCE